MIFWIVAVVVFVDFLGGTPLRVGIVAGQIIGGWKYKKERDQYEEACREGFNPVRQKETQERWKKAWTVLGDGPGFTTQLAYNRVELSDLEELRKTLQEPDLLPVESVKFLVGEYLLTEEEAFLFDQGVKAHLRRIDHAVDFWWMKQVSSVRIKNPKRREIIDEMRKQDEEMRRAA